MVGTVMDIPPLLRRLLIGGASSFNGDLSKWNVAEVTDMNRMFAPASSFNGDLSKWDVTKVTDMSLMFYGASSVNGDISKLNVAMSRTWFACCACLAPQR